MDLSDFPAATHDPLQPFLAFHRRAERCLGMLVDLSGRLDAGDMGERACASASVLLRFFGESMPRHHEAEERTLIPFLERRLAPGARRRQLRELRHEIEGDHHLMHETWRRVRTALDDVAQARARRLPLEPIQYYRALLSIHICAEEAALHRAARGHAIVTPSP